MDHPSDMTAQQRAALVTVRLCRGERLTNADVSAICGYETRNGSWMLMMQLSGLHEDFPLVYADGVWFLMGVTG